MRQVCFLLLQIVYGLRFSTWKGGSNFSISYDFVKNKLKYNVSCPVNTYLGISSKPSMLGTDMVVFQASDSGSVLDLWSQTFSTPAVDEINNYEVESITILDNIYTFIAYRSLDTGDTAQDTPVSCGKVH